MQEGTAPSSMARAGEILLLIGAILHTIVTCLLLLLVPLTLLGGTAVDLVLMLVLALVGGAGAVLLWIGLGEAQAGRHESAGTKAIIAAFLPPIGIIPLLAGIFLKVSDEARLAPQPPARPSHWDEMVIRQD